MKKLLTILLLLLPLIGFTQQSIGSVRYTVTMVMDFGDRPMPDHVKEMLKDMPKEQHFKKQLFFDPTHAFFANFDDPDAEPIDPSQMRGPMRFMRMRAEEEMYVNFEENRVAQQKEFFGRTFLIKDSLQNWEWKVTGETKILLDQMVMKATTMRDSMEIEAWFCPTIPVPGGPEGLGQLPGMILEATMRKGNFHIVADKIEFLKKSPKEIIEPTKGKEITREDFRTMQKEKRKEMRETRGRKGGGPPFGGGRPR